MTANQLHILRHSLGLDYNGHGREYRNYFCTGDGSDDYLDVLALRDLGFMRLSNKINEGRDEVWIVTPEGRAAALKDVVYPKLTRSQRRFQRFRDADCGLTFGEWLKTKWAQDDCDFAGAWRTRV